MSEIEKIIQKFLKEQIVPVIESSIQRAVSQALAEKEHTVSNPVKVTPLIR